MKAPLVVWLTSVTTLALAVGLALLALQQRLGEERERLRHQRTQQEEAVVEVVRGMRSALDRVERAERQRPFIDYFEALEPSSTDLAEVATPVWPTYLLGRFLVTSGGTVHAPSILPAPELRDAMGELLGDLRLRAARVQRRLGDILSVEVQASGELPLGERISQAQAEELLASLGLAAVLPEVVEVRTSVPRFVSTADPNRRMVAIVRQARVGDTTSILVGAVVDLDALWQSTSAVQRISRTTLELEGKGAPPPAGTRRVYRQEVDERRLPGLVVSVFEPSPSPLEVSSQAWRRLYFFFCLGLGGLVSLVSLAMWRFVLATERLAREREEFVAAVTHELRTPLTAIRMFAELVAGDCRDGTPAAKAVGHILGESQRLESLVENVLLQAVRGEGNLALDLEEGDVGAAITDILDRRRPAIEIRDFELRLDVEPGLPPVRFDPIALDRIVSNLIDNALKHGVGDSCEIDVGVRHRGSSVLIEVADRGHGLPAGAAARLFEPFATGGASTGARIGLGLAIVRDLAEAQGGRASAENRAIGGALFRVEIPITAQ